MSSLRPLAPLAHAVLRETRGLLELARRRANAFELVDNWIRRRRFISRCRVFCPRGAEGRHWHPPSRFGTTTVLGAKLLQNLIERELARCVDADLNALFGQLHRARALHSGDIGRYRRLILLLRRPRRLLMLLLPFGLAAQFRALGRRQVPYNSRRIGCRPPRSTFARY